jgi:hypothetical protein
MIFKGPRLTKCLPKHFRKSPQNVQVAIKSEQEKHMEKQFGK